MNQGDSLVRQAADAFKKGQYLVAYNLYRQLAEQIGDKYFQANLTLCQRRLNQYPDTKLADILLKNLRVAAVMDEFTHHSFAPECHLLQLRANTWMQQVADFNPDLVFIESAWRGLDGTWQNKVSDVSPELLELLNWAKQWRVPTVFWCKEDPVHFARFLPVARLVDNVFTTDIDCISRYKAELQHDRVYLLPFAAQPALHNPIETFPRENAFCFAGSYYNKYPERQANFNTLVTVGRKLSSVVIYDRNSKRPQPHDFSYPDEYRAELREALDYAEVDRAYKGYRFGITVNTIKQSQTMFARRAFELMACNTVVVSNFSRGLRTFFGDLVVSSDNMHVLEQRLEPLCSNERHYNALRLLGLRSVLAQHTYAHRLAHVVTCLSGRKIVPDLPRICIVAEPATTSQAKRLREAAARQRWPGATLLLLVGPSAADLPMIEGERLLPGLAELADVLSEYDYAAIFHADDHYGKDYLLDLALATTYFDGDALTKTCFYERLPDGSVQLVGDNVQYHPVPTAPLRCSLVRTQRLHDMIFGEAGTLCDRSLESGSILSVDEFSYCRSAQAGDTDFDEATVTAVATGRPPVDYEALILRTAERIPMPPARNDSSTAFLRLDPKALAKLLPWRIDKRLAISRDAQHRVVIESTLEPDQHAYIYLTHRFVPEELMTATEMRFKFEAELSAESPLNLCTVFVFKNAAEQKISQLTDKVGFPHALHIPVGTDHVRLALRAQGPGRATLGAFEVTPVAMEPIQAIPVVDNLVVVRGYPAYDDLYRYTFVHSRVQAYAKAGLACQVLCLGRSSDTRFREFEGVDVTEADAATLNHLLASGCYRHVLLHFADLPMWEVVAKYLDHIRITIWVHGAEIQPWWRRVIGGEPDASNAWAQRTNDERQKMWHQILCLRHNNLSLVFISVKQLRETLTDLHLQSRQLGHVEVIHNFIDSERFAYLPKSPEQRTRILSIRPYSSRIYGNDLMVEAILILSKSSFFNDLDFHIVGDGKLFDETVAPLRGLPNVSITKGFLTQQQISELHKEYGVFLVPSRMDSQGVSRDESMSSGLVPVTNRIAAIPEFVDAECGFLCEPEDACALAKAITTMYEDPDLFLSKSVAAARRVRNQSGYNQTIAREISLISARPNSSLETLAERLSGEEAACQYFALYGDINLNIMDGSAVWAASLAEVLGGIPDVRVTVVLKARIHRTKVIARLLDMAPAVQLIEPDIPERTGLTPSEAVASLLELDAKRPLHGLILRGLDVCHTAALEPSLQGRIWAYLTDIPQKSKLMDAATHSRIETIIRASAFVLCQTPQMREYFISLFPQANTKAKLLPPMVPPLPASNVEPLPDFPFRYTYAGKFAPLWGIYELFDAQKQLYSAMPDTELHVFGDKIHNPPDDKKFQATVAKRLEAGKGLQWHGSVERNELLRRLKTMHACWAYRDPKFERETLELSTKVLEYASLGLPIILARSRVFEELLGTDYPLFAATSKEASDLLLRLAKEPLFRQTAAARLQQATAKYTFAAVRERLRDDGLVAGVGEIPSKLLDGTN